MSTFKNPFAQRKIQPGEGEIVLSLLPPAKQLLTKFEYQYPLKLISPDPHYLNISDPGVGPGETNDDGSNNTKSHAPKRVPVTTIFLLTYGGGLLPGDGINLTITLQPQTRLALLTQGSTKIFKSKPNTTSTASEPQISVPSQNNKRTASQVLNVKLCPYSSLCYLPDPNQPYANSIYTQRQTFYVDPSGTSSLLFLDWVSEGRSARGEHWTLTSWKGRNEVREFDSSSAGRLLVRDALLLSGDDLPMKTDAKGVLGTLLIYGPMFKRLADFFLKEFKGLPRIGAKNWTPMPKTPVIVEVPEGHEGEKQNDYFGKSAAESQIKKPGGIPVEGLLWTAAQVRGFVLVKFSAREVDGARRWLGDMLRKEGSVEREFGHQALLCLR